MYELFWNKMQLHPDFNFFAWYVSKSEQNENKKENPLLTQKVSQLWKIYLQHLPFCKSALSGLIFSELTP